MNKALEWKDKKLIFYPVKDMLSLLGANVENEDGEAIPQLKTVSYRHIAGSLPELTVEFFDDPPELDPNSTPENPYARTYTFSSTNFEIRL